ncbi:hypothetical protein Ahia01_001139200 [Argonauta hians]
METIRKIFKKKSKDPNGLGGSYTIPDEIRHQLSEFNSDTPGIETQRPRSLSISRSGRFKPKKDRGVISQKMDLFQQPSNIDKKEDKTPKEDRKNESTNIEPHRTSRSASSNSNNNR